MRERKEEREMTREKKAREEGREKEQGAARERGEGGGGNGGNGGLFTRRRSSDQLSASSRSECHSHSLVCSRYFLRVWECFICISLLL